MKKCQYCSQEIQDDATKCRYCGEWLVKEKKGPLDVNSLKFPKIWVGYLLAVLFLALEITMAIINPQTSREKHAVLAFIIALTGFTYWCTCVHKIHKAIKVMSDNCYPISPARAVGFGFVPIYNIYWMFKWPSEVISFIKSRSNIKTWGNAVPGTLLLIAAFASRIDGAIWLAIDFGVLSYLIKKLKEDAIAKPEIVPYKNAPTKESIGLIVAIAIIPAIAIIALLAAIAIPNFIVARETAQARVCSDSLKQIQLAKVAWEKDTGSATNAPPKWQDLVPKYLSKTPACPKGGIYTIGDALSYPKCSIGNNNTTARTSDDHVLK